MQLCPPAEMRAPFRLNLFVFFNNVQRRSPKMDLSFIYLWTSPYNNNRNKQMKKKKKKKKKRKKEENEKNGRETATT